MCKNPFYVNTKYWRWQMHAQNKKKQQSPPLLSLLRLKLCASDKYLLVACVPTITALYWSWNVRCVCP